MLIGKSEFKSECDKILESGFTYPLLLYGEKGVGKKYSCQWLQAEILSKELESEGSPFSVFNADNISDSDLYPHLYDIDKGINNKVFITENVNSISRCLRSRLKHIYISPLSDNELFEYASSNFKLDTKVIRVMLKKASGNIHKFTSLVQEAYYYDTFVSVYRFITTGEGSADQFTKTFADNPIKFLENMLIMYARALVDGKQDNYLLSDLVSLTKNYLVQYRTGVVPALSYLQAARYISGCSIVERKGFMSCL